MGEHGTIWWNELVTRDAARARAFYGQVLGWSSDEMPMPDGVYVMAKANGTPVAGIFTMQGPGFDGVPEHWMTYIAVDNVDTRAAAVVAAGGKIMRPAFDVPGVGRIAIVADSGGAVVGFGTPVPGGA